MNTALDRLLVAIDDDESGHRSIDMFTFRYGGYEFCYMGHYYGYVYEGSSANCASEDEYGWDSYKNMLDSTIMETGKTVREMLASLPAHDLGLVLDIPMQQMEDSK